MKVLVSTTRGNGHKKGDFCFVPEGELLHPGMKCCNSESCGCNRALVGIDCHKATTTFKVEDLPLTKKDVLLKVAKSQKSAGWIKKVDIKDPQVKSIAKWICTVVSDYKVGGCHEIINDYLCERYA